MRRLVCCTYGSIAVLLGLACQSVPALADEPTSGPPTLSLSVTEPVRTGESVRFGGSSAYTSQEQLYLNVFVSPPTATGCPAQAVMPSGADPVLIDEPVDNLLTISTLSDELDIPGTWTLCGYLSNSQNATLASTDVSFAVSGPLVEEPEQAVGSSATPLAVVGTDAHHSQALRQKHHKKGKRHH